MKLYFMGLTDHTFTLGIPPNLICGTDTEKGDKRSHPNAHLLVCSSIMVPPNHALGNICLPCGEKENACI